MKSSREEVRGRKSERKEGGSTGRGRVPPSVEPEQREAESDTYYSNE